MKIFRNSCFVILSLFALHTYAQTTEENTSRMVNAKNYTFVATSASPMNVMDLNKVMSRMQGGIAQGGSINLNGAGYDLSITPDSLVAYLPYYGRAYTAPINQNESGVKFTSKKFVYTIAKREKGGWNVEIEVKDASESYRLNLNIGTSGDSLLSIRSNNKQTITYSGHLQENKPDRN